LKKEENLQISQVFCILDRENGGMKKLEQTYNIRVNSLFSLSDFN
jgi:orotate phosphoribosyltransferase